MKVSIGRLSTWTKITVSFTLILIVILTIIAFVKFGSISMALAYIAGDRLLVDSNLKSLGTVEAGRVQTVSFAFVNKTGHSVKILGSRSSCGCTFATNLPVQIPAGEFKIVKTTVDTTNLKGDFAASLNIFTDYSRQGLISLAIHGYVKPASSGTTTGNKWSR